MLNFARKLLVAVYDKQKQQMIQRNYKYLPNSNWKNKYPIVLVHGYFGSVADQSYMLGNYFHYATFAAQPYNDVYLAVINPIGGIHDKACELYQQLVGIDNIRARWGLADKESGPELVRAIYGHQHFCEEHTEQNAYKARYLR